MFHPAKTQPWHLRCCPCSANQACFPLPSPATAHATLVPMSLRLPCRQTIGSRLLDAIECHHINLPSLISSWLPNQEQWYQGLHGEAACTLTVGNVQAQNASSLGKTDGEGQEIVQIGLSPPTTLASVHFGPKMRQPSPSVREIAGIF